MLNVAAMAFHLTKRHRWNVLPWPSISSDGNIEEPDDGVVLRSIRPLYVLPKDLKTRSDSERVPPAAEGQNLVPPPRKETIFGGGVWVGAILGCDFLWLWKGFLSGGLRFFVGLEGFPQRWVAIFCGGGRVSSAAEEPD